MALIIDVESVISVLTTESSKPLQLSVLSVDTIEQHYAPRFK